MLKRKDEIVHGLTKGVDGLFKKNKITRYPGQAASPAPARSPSEAIRRADASWQPSTSSSPPAASPRILRGSSSTATVIGTSTEALSYPDVPKHLVVIGAGYIGLELGSVWRRLGAKVTVLEFLDRILPGMDAEIAAEARKIFEKQGIGVPPGHARHQRARPQKMARSWNARATRP